jgi:ribonuclease T2
MCSGGPLDEIWYHYNVLGSVQTGEFIATVPDGSKSDCAATGIKYLPKYQPTPTGSTSTPTATSVPNTPYKGKGYLQAYTGGANTGCLISAGTWFTTGTCAKYTAAASGRLSFTTSVMHSYDFTRNSCIESLTHFR